jgi:uncharacterized protein (DUF2336 family)
MMQIDERQEPTFGLDIQVFMDVIACGDSARRVNLGLQVARFLADPATPAGEREQILPVARRLAADPDSEVRRAFAEALSGHQALDADLLFTIVADEDDIALPFLAATPALDSLRMQAVLRAGGEARQAVIATRPDLSPDVVDVITRDAPLVVNALLLENEGAKLGPVQYRSIYQRFGAEKEMLERLLARPGLPPMIRIVQARRAAANLHAMLIERSWLSASQAAELVVDAEETATLEVLAGASAFDLPAAIAFLIDNDMLTPSLIVHAACQGIMHVVAECLASLSGLPLRRVEEQMYERGKFRSLHARCGLPQSCFWTLQAACDVESEAREDGITLSAEEFGAHLIEKLLTRYEAMPLTEHPRNLGYIGRFAAEGTRHLATRLRADLQAAA